MSALNKDAQNPRWPIYIGEAIPPGGIKGNFTVDATNTNALYVKLRQHAESIDCANNLEVSDFVCRFLVAQDLWIPLAEQLLIAHFAPLWNKNIDGFGNHDPGAGLYGDWRRAGMFCIRKEFGQPDAWHALKRQPTSSVR
jgi:hypothetical protein